ncbi:Hpt domain-containing protein [Ferruginibacter paludis]|uniref:Hpt domain-containing protein n=1 Tax=Ferruginibacter TaxID=1004303 RepID=UPI0025B324D4|nr:MULTISPECIES: Hpt domain-containing protein [Ferruginibacter]MDB5278687.1 Hpt domain protein [Ferruginibacter sp.]MDN3656921.1 Hpt domain-containing protein [Ferruginibacter paludis]
MNDGSFEFNAQLDGQFLESIYDGDHEHAEMVFEQFIQSVNGHMDEIEAGFNSGDAEVFRKAIHKFKPVLSFVGLTKLTEAAANIEKKCTGMTDVNNLATLYTLLKNELIEKIPIIQNDLIKLKSITS